MRDLQDKMRTLCEPLVTRLGYDLVAVEWLNDGRGQILRMSIEKEGGINAKDCGRVSGHISQLLDEVDPIASSFRLEVSSPGIERPVQRLVDFERFVGFTCRVRLVEGHPRRRFTGKLLGISGEDVLVQVDNQEHRFNVDAVERANLVLDLDEFARIAEITGAVISDTPAENDDDQQ